jgi:hypothetical protein
VSSYFWRDPEHCSGYALMAHVGDVIEDQLRGLRMGGE